jgi:hypothetical protein
MGCGIHLTRDSGAVPEGDAQKPIGAKRSKVSIAIKPLFIRIFAKAEMSDKNRAFIRVNTVNC